jgi:hypothetical protein
MRSCLLLLLYDLDCPLHFYLLAVIIAIRCMDPSRLDLPATPPRNHYYEYAMLAFLLPIASTIGMQGMSKLIILYALENSSQSQKYYPTQLQPYRMIVGSDGNRHHN